MKNIKNIITMLLALLIISNCEDNSIDDNFAIAELYPISIYMGMHPEKFGMWKDILQQAELDHSFNASGTYTMYAPNNKAVEEWLSGRAVSSISKEAAAELVFNHVINKPYIHTDYNEGAIPDTNMNGHYIAVEFGDGAYQNIKLNKSSLILEKDIKMTNGFINEIDHVMDILPNLSSVLSNLEGVSVFTEAIEKTGYSQELTSIEKEVDGIAKRQFRTVMAIADSTFARLGINNIDELILKYTDENNLTDKINPFNQWVAYHILGEINYTNQLIYLDSEQEFKNVMTLAIEQGVEIRDDRAIVINREVIDDVVYETHIYKDRRNIPAVNGAIHFIDDFMDIYQVKPFFIRQDIWDVANWRAIENYRSGQSGSIEWIDEDVFEEVSWHSEPEQVPIGYWQHWNHEWYKGGNGIVLDFNRTNTGWVEFKTPYLAAGTYRVKLMGHKRPEGGQWKAYFDGVPAGTLDNYYAGGGDAYGLVAIPSIEVTSGVHTIRLEHLTGSGYIGVGDVKYYPL
ncbi:fasciclin domain-containing protein [Tamlana sp. 2201CG12-4]|uniref:fasciclin domain-containing protein n=1 Tax=Tamlana sp. 2201CG12-4 TaxID=3112582 RepID=UPI002DBC0D7A|nr:fasciclin domain-containing protein [Tamlana sp. 2201CG12-4]MEC3907211.1 fasciclin domain-containing protein [Tamlana sp. 2201CG12-4]